MPNAARLASVPLFQALSPEELDQIASWMEEREVSPGRELTPEGGHGYQFFVIADGTAEVSHDGDRVADLGPGDYFGEIALLADSSRRVASVVATSV